MTKNALAVIAALAALATIFYFGTVHRPAPVETPPKATPAPAEPAKVPVKTPVTPTNRPKDPKVIYHRVEQGGAQGPEMQCVDVKPFAEGKSQAELAVLAKQYGVSVDQVKRWFICTN